MALQSLTGGWRAISDLAQINIGTVQPVTQLLNFEGTDLIEPEPNTYFLNTTEITGELLPTKKVLLNKKLSFKHKCKATPTTVALFASMAMGKDTASVVGATTAYMHKIQLDKTVVDLPTRTMVENDGSSQFAFAGIACAGFTISASRGEFVEFEADLVGSASEGADVTAKPTASPESYLTCNDCKLYQGGAYDGSIVTGGTEISAQVQSFKMEFKNGAKEQYLMGDPSGLVGSIRRGLTYTVDFEAEIELTDRSQRTAMLAGTEYVFRIPIVGGTANGVAKYTVEPTFPRVAYMAAKKGVSDGILKVGAKFAVLSDSTYGAFDLRVINLQAHNYLATA